MGNLRSYILSALLLGCLSLMAPITADACSAPSPPSARTLIISADTIVRATALELVKEKGIRFRVEEVLKGEQVPQTLVVKGSFSGEDDFNDQPAPYDFVRKAGRGGTCFAYTYKQGAQFLLLLKKQEGELTPYWIPFAPANEQLRSADDPWVVWVKDNLKWVERASEFERIQLAFDEMKRGNFDTDKELLWKYRFSDSDEEKLRRLAAHLETLGYRLVDISRPDGKAEGAYTLQAEKAEIHTPATMLQRNQEFRALAITFGVNSYNRWVVSRVK
jgi:hypothetical protein